VSALAGSGKTQNGGCDLCAAVNGGFDRIGEIAVLVANDAKIDAVDVAGESLARDSIIERGGRQAAGDVGHGGHLRFAHDRRGVQSAVREVSIAADRHVSRVRGRHRTGEVGGHHYVALRRRYA